MSKAKKLLATALVTVSVAAVPATNLALSGAPSVALACGNSGSSSCG
jgi:hypothetical protein